MVEDDKMTLGDKLRAFLANIKEELREKAEYDRQLKAKAKAAYDSEYEKQEIKIAKEKAKIVQKQKLNRIKETMNQPTKHKPSWADEPKPMQFKFSEPPKMKW